MTSLSLHDIVSDFIRKTTGLLLKHNSDQKMRKMLVKPGEHARFTELEVAPIFPDCELLFSNNDQK